MSTERITGAFRAETPEEAVRLAKEWIHAEPNVRLRTVCSVRPATRSDGARWPGVWSVELAVSAKDPT